METAGWRKSIERTYDRKKSLRKRQPSIGGVYGGNI